jgi:hypothetical protein
LFGNCIIIRKKGLSAIAITDHDTIMGYKNAVLDGLTSTVEVIPGIELSTVYEGQSIHILGYYIDISTEIITDALQKHNQKYITSMIKLLRYLKSIGLEVSMDDINGNTDKINLQSIIDKMISKGIVRRYLNGGNRPDQYCFVKRGERKSLKYTMEEKKLDLVHSNYLCTVIVKP